MAVGVRWSEGVGVGHIDEVRAVLVSVLGIGKLRQVDVLVSPEHGVADAIRLDLTRFAARSATWSGVPRRTMASSVRCAGAAL